MVLADGLIAALEPRAREHGLELVTVEVIGGGRHRTVRVFLDREGGIDIDAIADANPWISEVLDAMPQLSGPFTLEVSSPGIERPLRTREHFERFTGEKVSVQTHRPIDGRSRFTGTLVGFDGDEVVIQADDGELRVPFDGIERARLKADFGTATERDGKNR
jgi:ribosome maturation factor RimP